MANNDIALMAHLMRRAGFGASYEELEERAAKGYEATVEELLHPEDQPDGIEMDVLERYFAEWQGMIAGGPNYWAWRMINSRRPLEEKIALFWHGILCTGHAKCENPRQQNLELDMFRRDGMGRFSDLLLGLAVDPAMVFFALSVSKSVAQSASSAVMIADDAPPGMIALRVDPSRIPPQ